MKLRPVDLSTLAPEVFHAFATKNALLTAGDRESCNTMTIGWCQMGRIWNQLVCTVFVRPERYTYQFTEKQDYFTVSILPDEDKTTLKFCGSKSGRDVNKIRECGLTLCYGAGDAPFFEEAEMVLVCKKLYAQDMEASCAYGQDVVMPFYETGNWHRIYMGQIAEAYVKE